MEILLVVIILSIGTAFALPSLRAGVENRKAKQVAECAKAIGHAVQMHEADNGTYPTSLQDLVNAGYVVQKELAYGNEYVYSVIPPQGANGWVVQAVKGVERTISVTFSNNRFQVDDSAGFIHN